MVRSRSLTYNRTMDFPAIDFSKYEKAMTLPYFKMRGKVINVVGLTIESAGPAARLGDICRIYPKNMDGEGAMSGEPTKAEVVGFKNGKVLLMPYENTYGIGEGSIVENTGEALQVYVPVRGRSLPSFVVSVISFVWFTVNSRTAG